MKYLILGSNGFVARHYIDFLLNQKSDHEIVGIDIEAPSNLANPKLSFIKLSLLSREDLRNTLIQTNPDFIIHLASHSSVAFSWQYPYESFTNNIYCFLNLLEELRSIKSKAKVLLVGSSEEYGQIDPQNLPLQESAPLNPTSPYAISRAAQTQLAKVYAQAYSLNIICTRSFNHLGPRQPTNFVVSSFVKQAFEIKLGLKNSFNCGNIEIVRDFIDVRDVIVAYDLLLHKGKTGNVYNVCSGQGHKLKDVIDIIKKILNIDFQVNIDPTLTRPIDNPIIIGSNQKLQNETGFKPRYTIEQSIQDMIKQLEVDIQKSQNQTQAYNINGL